MEHFDQDLTFFEFFRRVKQEELYKKLKENKPNMKEFEIEDKFMSDKGKASIKRYIKAKRKFYSEDQILDEYFADTMQLYDRLTNKSYDKVRKYKILYFLYASFIYYSGLVGKNNNFFSEKTKPFKKDEEFTWCAFAKGPILKDTYNYFGEDGEIYINLKDMTDGQINILKRTLVFLSLISTEVLIDKSHLTSPWDNKFDKNKYWILMNSYEIKEYFLKHNPLEI